MFDNQMSVFTQQLEFEPKFQECEKKAESMKLQVVLLPAVLHSPARVSQLTILFATRFPLQLIKCTELEGKLAAIEGRRGMDRCC
jgi:hypothetical protein